MNLEELIDEVSDLAYENMNTENRIVVVEYAKGEYDVGITSGQSVDRNTIAEYDFSGDETIGAEFDVEVESCINSIKKQIDEELKTMP